MFLSDKLVGDREYREYHLRDLQVELVRGHDAVPVVGQISGNDIETLVQAARIIQPYVDAIGMSSFLFPQHICVNISLHM